MDRNEAILAILSERLAAAEQRSKAAARGFNSLLADIPSGIPAPDGTTRIRQAAKGYRVAMRELSAAQEQLTLFLIYNVVPDDVDLGLLN